ncbi:hypothetical protein, partial [uncultured Bacteroides sp.]|uniref:hypothetical protein n=1 Tax=uncultured Bacteroides sp. TaxID=162156 RepID=UPI00258A78E9
YHFFACFLKQFCNSLIDKDVVEHIFKRRCGRARKDIHYIYACTREGGIEIAYTGEALTQVLRG